MADFDTIRANAKRVLAGQMQYADAMNTAIDEIAIDAINQATDVLETLHLSGHAMLLALAYMTGGTAASFFDKDRPEVATATLTVVMNWMERGVNDALIKKNA